MSDFDDLRGAFYDDEDFEEIDDSFDQGGQQVEERRFLGMTAIERMFLSIFLFLNVAVIGIALLLATGRIGG